MTSGELFGCGTRWLEEQMREVSARGETREGEGGGVRVPGLGRST